MRLSSDLSITRWVRCQLYRRTWILPIKQIQIHWAVARFSLQSATWQLIKAQFHHHLQQVRHPIYIVHFSPPQIKLLENSPLKLKGKITYLLPFHYIAQYLSEWIKPVSRPTLESLQLRNKIILITVLPLKQQIRILLTKIPSLQSRIRSHRHHLRSHPHHFSHRRRWLHIGRKVHKIPRTKEQ